MSNDASLDEALKLERLREKLPARPEVLEIRHEPYTDALGARELKITVILANDTRDDEINAANMQAIRSAIQTAVGADPRFPYIRFLTREEFDAPDEE